MRLSSQALVVGVFSCCGWVASGIGANVGKSDLRNGGEVGWYFYCVYFTPQRSFEVNYTHAPRAPVGAASFWEKRTDCPRFAHKSLAAIGWRH